MNTFCTGLSQSLGFNITCSSLYYNDLLLFTMSVCHATHLMLLHVFSHIQIRPMSYCKSNCFLCLLFMHYAIQLLQIKMHKYKNVSL